MIFWLMVSSPPQNSTTSLIGVPTLAAFLGSRIRFAGYSRNPRSSTGNPSRTALAMATAPVIIHIDSHIHGKSACWHFTVHSTALNQHFSAPCGYFASKASTSSCFSTESRRLNASIALGLFASIPIYPFVL